MFDVGFWELVLIFGVGLMILGPERMPRVASQIGRWVGRARRTASSLRRQLEQEIAMSDYKPPPPPKRKPTHITPVNGPKTDDGDASEQGSAEAAGGDVPDPSGAGPSETEAPAAEEDERKAGGP